MYRVNAQYLFLMSDRHSGDEPWGAALMDKSLDKVQLFTTGKPMNNGLFSDPLEGNFGELLLIFWLAHHQGLLVHACGVSDDGKG